MDRSSVKNGDPYRGNLTFVTICSIILKLLIVILAIIQLTASSRSDLRDFEWSGSLGWQRPSRYRRIWFPWDRNVAGNQLSASTSSLNDFFNNDKSLGSVLKSYNKYNDYRIGKPWNGGTRGPLRNYDPTVSGQYKNLISKKGKERAKIRSQALINRAFQNGIFPTPEEWNAKNNMRNYMMTKERGTNNKIDTVW